MAKFTIDDFIKKSMSVHGDKYDYSKVVYVNSKTKVKIICPIHGEFEQKPEKHWIGHGCPGCAQAKVEATNLKKYGVRRPIQNKEIHKRQRKTVQSRYGADNPSAAQSVKDKRRKTVQDRYGVDYACQADVVRKKREATNIERYGGISPFASKDVQDKAHDTILQRYGVENVFQNSDVRAKFEETCRERYGTAFAIQSDIVRKKIQDSCMKLYGSKTPLEAEQLRDKISNGVVDKYGVDNVMKVEAVKQRVLDTKKENGSFHTSVPEDIMYDVLCKMFGDADIERQYKSVSYPFPCDFYVKSLDLYIELNAHWSHGNHWFNDTDVADTNMLSEWQSHKDDSLYYENAINVWTHRDVLKRQTAIKNHLNYIVFWDNDLKDFELWLSLGHPVSNDGISEYSWL